jgi:oxalate decarboxylase
LNCFPHSIQGLGPDGAECLLAFNQATFSKDETLLVSESVAHIPPELLAKNMRLVKSVFAQTLGAPLYIFPGSLPDSLEQDKSKIGGERVADENLH